MQKLVIAVSNIVNRAIHRILGELYVVFLNLEQSL